MKRITALFFSGLVMMLVSAPQNAGAQVQPGGEVFRQEGIASWYGTEFDGRPTASGEIFNSSLFTAAHPTLPFGTALIITNTHNGKKVTVRVNDRGPFVSARIIDLSKAAAEQLDMLVTGTAPVLVESAGKLILSAETAGQSGEPAPVRPWAESPADLGVRAPALPPSPPPARAMPAAPENVPGLRAAVLKPAVPPGSGKIYRLQVGAYRIARNAVEAFDKLKNAGLNPAYERNGELFRVVLAGVRAEDVSLIAEKLWAAGFAEALVREER